MVPRSSLMTSSFPDTPSPHHHPPPHRGPVSLPCPLVARVVDGSTGGPSPRGPSLGLASGIWEAEGTACWLDE